MQTYRVGIIGTGRIASEFEDRFDEHPVSIAGAFAALPQCELVAACSRGRERLERFGKRWNVTALYHDYREMLARERLDIVAVATPPALHCEQVVAAARAGARGIFCEKPMALSLGECDAMIAACREQECRLLINCTRRWHGQFEAIRREAAAGRWGELLHLAGYCQGCKPLPEWESEHEGPLLHDAVHLFDLMRFFGGNVSWVLGTAECRRRHELRAEDCSHALLQFDSGARGLALVDELTEHARFGLQLHFERGLVEMGRNFTAEKAVRATDVGEEWWWRLEPDEVPAPSWEGTPILNAARDLVACIESGGEPRSNGEDGRAALEVIMALYQSQRQGNTPVALPFNDSRRMLAVLREEGVY